MFRKGGVPLRSQIKTLDFLGEAGIIEQYEKKYTS